MSLQNDSSRLARNATVLAAILVTTLVAFIAAASPAAAASTLYAATSDNQLWSRDAVLYEINWTPIGHANHVTGMSGGGGRLWATADGKLWTRPPSPFVDWTMVDIDPGVVALAYGTVNDKYWLFAATGDGRLLAREASVYQNPWYTIGAARGVTALAFGNNTLFAATTDNRLLARLPILSPANWSAIGHANNVAAMTFADGRLFAATRDNVLWARIPYLYNINWQNIGHANYVVGLGAL